MGREIVSIDDLTVNNLGTFKKINEVSLPTRFGDDWYKTALQKDQLVQLAYYAELPVGAIKAKAFNTNLTPNKFEPHKSQQLPSGTIPNAVYIESFAVLEAYRGLHIGSKLLEYVIKETKKRFIHEIYLHTPAANKERIEWYEKKGFIKQDEVACDYYKDQGLKEADAVILKLAV